MRTPDLRHLLFPWLLAAAAAPAAASPLLLDTYQDDSVGAAPNGPEWGSATYGTGILVGTPIGQYRVVDAGGSQRLQVSTTGTPGQGDNGTLIEFNPLPGTQGRFGVQYQFQLQPGGTQLGQNAWMQEIILDPLGTNLALMWPQAGQNVALFTSRTGDPNTTTVNLGLPVAEGHLYSVDWLIDLAADRFSLSVDGVALVAEQALGIDAGSMRQLAAVNNFSTSGSVLLDNVRIDALSVPEPTLLALLLAAVPGLRRRARR